MKRQRVRVNLDISSFRVADEDTSRAPTPKVSARHFHCPAAPSATHRSVARASFAIVNSSVDGFFEPIGVVPLLETGAESTAVELPSAVLPPSFCFRAAFAAFSARRFCLDAEGGILRSVKGVYVQE